MAVIEPYMKPREYGDLDVFTNYWASYTGARSAKWEQRMQLVLQQMDSGQTDDLIDDLRRRRDDLVDEQRRLRRYQIGDVSRQERDVRRTSTRKTTTSTAALNQYVGRVGEYAKYNASAKERYNQRQQEEHALLAEEEKDKTEETRDFYRLISTSWAAQNAADGADSEPHKGDDYYKQYFGAMMSREKGTSEAAVRTRDAHALALYQGALERGHTSAAEYIARTYDGFLGTHPSTLLDERTHTVAEMAKVREDRLARIGPPVGVNTQRIYDEARRQYRIENPEEAAEAESTAAETTDPLQSAYDLYGAEQVGVSAQIAALDAQIAALAAAKQTERALGMNMLQAMLNENWNFAPPKVRVEQSPFIEQVAEYDPLRVGTYMENVEEYGTQGALRRAQLRGEVSPYDPITTTSVREYAATDQGAFVFGHLHDEVQDIERMLSQPGGEENIVEAYAKVMGLSGQTARIFQLGKNSEPFSSKLTPFAQNLGPLWQSDDSALKKRFMGAGYREVTASDGRVVRQYGDGQITVDGAVVDEPGMADVFDGPIDPQKFTGFDHQREGLPPMDDVLAEIGSLRSIAQAEMGADDRMLGELMSFSLNESMANPDPSARMRDIYTTNQMVSELPRSLVGDRSIQLSQAMELTAARGSVEDLFGEVDKIIEAGQDQSVRDREFAEYMKEYGPTIEAGPQELVDRSRGVIQPRKEDVFRIGEGLDPLSEERRLKDEQARMEFEALDRARMREHGTAELEDALFPQPMRAESTYRLTPEQEATLEDYKAQRRELLTFYMGAPETGLLPAFGLPKRGIPITPGVSTALGGMSPRDEEKLKELEYLISKYEGMKTEPREKVETGPLEAAETAEGAARFRAFEEQLVQPTPATPAATLLSIPYLTRMGEEGKVEPGRIEELKAAIEGIEFGDPEIAKQSAESAREILLEQFEVSQAMLSEARQEALKAEEEHRVLGETIDKKSRQAMRQRIEQNPREADYYPSGNVEDDAKRIAPLVDRYLDNAAKNRGYESFADLKFQKLQETKARADAAREKSTALQEPLKAIQSDLLKLDAHALGLAGPKEGLVADLPAHLRNRELIGRIKGQNPDLMEVPDAELWEALLGQKQKMVSEGKLIEGLWAEINP